MNGLSAELPLVIDGIDGAYKLHKTIPPMVKQNLKMLLLTSPGERVMISNFGVGLRRYLFEPNDETTKNEIQGKISEQVELYLPFIELNDLIITTGNEYEGLIHFIGIKIDYNIIPLNSSDVLELSLKAESNII